jgi:hypothetical protein
MATTAVFLPSSASHLIHFCRFFSGFLMYDVYMNENGWAIPDTYSKSFYSLGVKKVISLRLSNVLVLSVKLRNVIVHEYDLEEDPKKFFCL